MNRTEVRNIVKQIICDFSNNAGGDTCPELGNMKRKKQARELIKFCKRKNTLLFLDDRYRETSRWEVIYGGWSLTTKNISAGKKSYDKIGFDLDIDLPGRQINKKIYIIISKHALERFILRTDMPLNTSNQIRHFLNQSLKTILMRCLAMWDSAQDKLSTEGYAVANNLFIPISMEVGLNKLGVPTRCFTIKTVMPSSYNGAKKSIKTVKQLEPEENIFQYWHLLNP